MGSTISMSWLASAWDSRSSAERLSLDAGFSLSKETMMRFYFGLHRF